MKQYTFQDAASALGIDTETLNQWIREADITATIDSHNPRVYLLSQSQLDELAQAHNLQRIPDGHNSNSVQVNQLAQINTQSMIEPDGHTSAQIPAAPIAQEQNVRSVASAPSAQVVSPAPQVAQVPPVQAPQSSSGQDGQTMPSDMMPPAQPASVPPAVHISPPAATAGVEADPQQQPRIATQDLPDGNHVQVQKDVPDIRPIILDGSVITIGRLPSNSIVLNHPLVSGHHAVLTREDDGEYTLADLKSTNHVYVNAKRVKKRHKLHEGDEIRIGPFKLVYSNNQLTQADVGSSTRIDALHLTEYGNRRGIFRRAVLLNDISLDIPPHSFVALLGSSGAGKSTLMNALSGLQPAQKGDVLYNGQDYYEHIDAYNTQIGYVPQDDIVHQRLTVEHALYYTARMRLPKDYTHAQIRERVDEVLADVEMAHRRKALVMNLSGGERKRVSIALELLANPSVFFLDEPTSGLDAGLDLKMMELLRRLADKGHTIVLVTHTTTNIEYCHYICFLAKGGRVAFYGPPQEALKYFGTNNFAEIYNMLEPTDEQPDIPERAEELFKQSPYYQQYIAQPLAQLDSNRPTRTEPVVQLRTRERSGSLRQFFLLSRRYLELLKNDTGNLLLLLLQAPVIALILWYLASPGTFNPTSIAYCPTRQDPTSQSGPIVSISCQRVVDMLNTPQGTAFVQQNGLTKEKALNDAIQVNSGADAQTLLFIMAFAAVLFGCINGAREIVKELPVYRRERMVNLRILPYMFSKIVILGILCLLQCAVLVYVVNLKAPFHQGIFLPVVWEVYITMALTSLAGLMLGLTISAIAPNTDRAMSFIPIVLVPQVIFSGIIFKLNSPILQAIGALFADRWAMAGLGSSVGLHADKLGVDNFAYQGTLYTALNPATVRPAAITHLFIVWGALVAMILILGFASAFFLRRKGYR